MAVAWRRTNVGLVGSDLVAAVVGLVVGVAATAGTAVGDGIGVALEAELQPSMIDENGRHAECGRIEAGVLVMWIRGETWSGATLGGRGDWSGWIAFRNPEVNDWTSYR